jgi:hypothetical protein
MTRLSPLAALAVASLALGGCTVTVYHPDPLHPPAANVHAALWNCIGATVAAAQAHPPPVLPGLLPTLLLGSTMGDPNRGQIIDTARDECMAQQGWTGERVQ